MNAFTTVKIPADPTLPMVASSATGYEDLNRDANCSTGSTCAVPAKEGSDFFGMKYDRSKIRYDLWIDDEGWLRDNPNLNLRASLMAGQQIVGDAVLTACNPRTGDSVDIETPLMNALVLAWMPTYQTNADRSWGDNDPTDGHEWGNPNDEGEYDTGYDFE